MMDWDICTNIYRSDRTNNITLWRHHNDVTWRHSNVMWRHNIPHNITMTLFYVMIEFQVSLPKNNVFQADDLHLWPMTLPIKLPIWPRYGPATPPCKISCPYIKRFSRESAHRHRHRHTDGTDYITSTAEMAISTRLWVEHIVCRLVSYLEEPFPPFFHQAKETFTLLCISEAKPFLMFVNMTIVVEFVWRFCEQSHDLIILVH